MRWGLFFLGAGFLLRTTTGGSAPVLATTATTKTKQKNHHHPCHDSPSVCVASSIGRRWRGGSHSHNNNPRQPHDAHKERAADTANDDDSKKWIVLGIDGGTESVRAACYDGRTGQRLSSAVVAVPYATTHPQPGWAEQDVETWYDCLVQAVRGALAAVPPGSLSSSSLLSTAAARHVAALCVDTTCCSVVALDADGRPLRPCLLWMDQRAATQAVDIRRQCHNDKGDGTHDDDDDDSAALAVSGDGQSLSAEWMLPKALWLAQNEPEIYRAAEKMGEYQDYINWRLTGRWVASACNAATRWHWNAHEAMKEDEHISANSNSSASTVNENDATSFAGRPISLYRRLGLSDLAHKLPRTCLPMGAVVGPLTSRAAADLGLPPTTQVIQGGPDAFVGMLGLGCVQPRQSCLITGSSHLHCVVTDQPRTATGIWGAYRAAPLPHLCFAEGGQSSTGSLLRWARTVLRGNVVESTKMKEEEGTPGEGENSLTNTHEAKAMEFAALSYAEWDAQAAQIPPGSDGLIALETWQGSRTPVTDPLARGALLGLTLSHGPAHIWRALMEAVCLGTRACLEGLEAAGHACDEIRLAGGITRSPLWLQMHADVTGKDVIVCENADAPLLGCAMLAAVGVGLHDSVDEAAAVMVKVAKRIEPNPATHQVYTNLFTHVYQPMVEQVREVSHALHRWRGGGSAASPETSLATTNRQYTAAGSRPRSRSAVVVSPSLLACDWGNMRHEVQRCVQAGACRLHVDVFDGVFLDSPRAFTFGPGMVQSIYNSLEGEKVRLDLHMCVMDPSRFVSVMAEVAPGQTFIFQWEAVPTVGAATALAQRIVDAQMECGVSINPSTPVEDILPLLESGLVSVVDVLAVEPGFGGQAMQPSALSKVTELRAWLDERGNNPTVLLMVDGGVNLKTAGPVRSSGADILVSGSFLFRQDLASGIKSLLQS